MHTTGVQGLGPGLGRAVVFRQTAAQQLQSYGEENVTCSRSKTNCSIPRAWIMKQGGRFGEAAGVRRG